MSSATNNRAVISYRAKATLWFTITGLVVLPPFSINNFIHERFLLGWMSLLVIVILLFQAWSFYRGRYTPIITLLGMIPSIIIFLAFSFEKQGIIGALWCYPAMSVFCFMLPKRQAIYAILGLLVVAIPSSWFFLDPPVAARFFATFMIVAIITIIFIHIIEQQQNELEIKEHQRRDSMAGASHELRTPLAMLMAQIEAMRDGVRPLNQKQLALLANSVDHLTDLVDDLYLLSLADVSALTINKEPQQLDMIVGEAVASARSKLADHNLSITPDIAANVLVNGDAKRLRQIIDNLLENCYRYATSGGEIFVTLKHNDNWAELTVADTGPGVSDEALSMLFERFYRVDKSRSRQQGGTGLGLSLVKALVETHEGQVSAFHSPEGGLGITIRLPLLD